MPAKNSNLNIKSEMKYNKKNELIFYKPRIFDCGGNPYKPMPDLDFSGIRKRPHFQERVKELQYECFHENKRNQTLCENYTNHQPVPDEYPIKIRLGGNLIPFSKIVVEGVYKELQKKVCTMEATNGNGKQH